MEQTPAARFVELLTRLGYKTQQQIADLLEIARPTAGTIVRQEKDPSFASMARLKYVHPAVNVDWVFSGQGSAFVTSAKSPAPTEPDPTPTPPAAPAGIASAPTDVVAQFMALLAEREATLKKDHRAQLILNAKDGQRTIERMRHEIDMLSADVYYLRGLVGHRAPSPEEVEQQKRAAQEQIEFQKRVAQEQAAADAAARPAPIAGFGTNRRSRETPQGAEAFMQSARGESSFTRPLKDCLQAIYLHKQAA